MINIYLGGITLNEAEINEVGGGTKSEAKSITKYFHTCVYSIIYNS